MTKKEEVTTCEQQSEALLKRSERNLLTTYQFSAAQREHNSQKTGVWKHAGVPVF